MSIATLESSPRSAVRIPPPRRRWLTRVALPGAIALVTLGLLAYAARDFLLPAAPVRIVRAVAKPVEIGPEEFVAASAAAADAPVVAQAPGWVEPDPFPIHVSALTDGVIREVLVLEGEEVSPNKTVAKLDDQEAKLATRRVKAELARRKAVLDAAAAEWDNPIAQQRAVAVNKAMLAETAAEREQVGALMKAEQAKLAELEGVLNRMRQLPAGTVAQENVERTAFQVDAQRAAATALSKQIVMLEAKTSRYEAEVKAAEADLRLRIEAKRLVDEAQAEFDAAKVALEEAELREARMEVKAPVGGTVMMRYAAPGSRVMLGGSDAQSAFIVDLYDPAKLQVRADVPLSDAAKIGVGQRAQIVVDVLPDRVFEGKVTRLVHQADIGKNTIQVKVAIESPSPQLKPEMLARVKFLSQEPAKAAAGGTQPVRTALRVFAPESALHSENGQAKAPLVDARSGALKYQPVKLGRQRAGRWVEVLNGLNPNDSIVLDARGLHEGDRLRVIEESADAP